MAITLGFDVGTQGTKGVALDDESGIVARASVGYGLIDGLPAGAAEQHPDTWIDAVRDVSRALMVNLDPSRVVGVGVSGQQHGLVALDREGRPVRPAKLWCDTTTADEARELSAALGRPIPTGFTAPKVLWMQRHEPDVWGRVRSVMLPHDYVNYRLTGERVTEAGDASGTGYFDPVARAYDAAAVGRLGVGAMVPPLVDPGSGAGVLHGEGAALLGLREGVPVSAGGGDNMMSAIGSGATEPGVVVVSLGTSGTAFAFAEHPVVDGEGLIAPFCDSTGGWLPLLCVMNMTGVAEEVCAAFSADHEELTRAAQSVPAGADGLRLLPYLVGERVPNLPEATGVLAGLRPGLLRPGHVYRAALEGTALSLGAGLDRMAALGLAVSTARLVGGGANNPLWRRVLADVLRVPVQRLAELESAALGAAVQAMWTVRRAGGDTTPLHRLAAPFVRLAGQPVEPDPARVALYRAASREQAELCRRLFSTPARA